MTTSVSIESVYAGLTPFLPGLPGAMIKSTLLLVLLIAIATLLRRASASTRHLVWSVGLLGVLAIPFMSQVLPWELDVLPAPSSGIVSSSTPAPAPAPVSGGGAPQVPESEAAVTESENEGASRAGVFFGESQESSSALATPVVGAAGKSGVNLAQLLVGIWFAGAAMLLAWILLGAILVRRIVRRATPLRSYRWVQLLQHVSDDMDVLAPVRLVRSGALPMPVTAGVVRPVVILPEGCEDWDEDRRRAVLMHELAHVRRHDLVFHMISRVACALYWFHPLVWFAARKLRVESERSCDDLVLNAGTRASDYADHLLQIVRAAGHARTPAVAVPMAQRSEFEGRLLAILEPGVHRNGLTVARGLAITLGLALSTVPLAALGRASLAPATPESSPIQAEFDATTNGLLDDDAVDVATSGGDTPIETTLDEAKPKKTGQGDKATRPAPASGLTQREVTTAQNPAADPVAALVTALDDPDRDVRLSALQALASMDDPRAVPGAMRALDSDDPEMRSTGLSILAEMADPRALPGVIRLLQDPDHRVRVTAAEAAGRFQDSTAIAALSRALRTDADPEVRKTAAWALGEIEDSRAIPALIEALQGDTSAEVRATAANALGEIEDPAALDALGAAVRDESSEVRRQAIRAIGEIDDRRAVPVLVPLLDDADPEVRQLAVWALSELEDPSTVAALGKATQDANMEVRRMAVRGLGEIEDPSGLDYLIVALQDSDAEVRYRAAWAMGEIEDVRALEPLVGALSDENAEVRSQAVHALGHLEDSRAQEGLSLALADENVDVRVQAADALGELDLATAPPALLGAMTDPSAEVRKVAAHSLGHIGDPGATEALAAAVTDQNREVRLTSLEALGEMGTQRSVEIIIAAMQSEDPEVRRVAAQMLGKRGDR